MLIHAYISHGRFFAQTAAVEVLFVSHCKLHGKAKGERLLSDVIDTAGTRVMPGSSASEFIYLILL